MSRFPHVTIAEVTLQDLSGRWCRADFIDAEALKGTLVAATATALDGTVHTQWTDRARAGVRFGVRVAQLHISKLEDIVAAMETALQAGESFTVAGADTEGVDDLDVQAVIDYASLGGKPYTRGAFSGAYVQDVTFRFVTTGEA